jgi:hypothetical protein
VGDQGGRGSGAYQAARKERGVSRRQSRRCADRPCELTISTIPFPSCLRRADFGRAVRQGTTQLRGEHLVQAD